LLRHVAGVDGALARRRRHTDRRWSRDWLASTYCWLAERWPITRSYFSLWT